MLIAWSWECEGAKEVEAELSSLGVVVVELEGSAVLRSSEDGIWLGSPIKGFCALSTN